MKIISVVGARPNFMKVAPFIHAINSHNELSSNKIEHLLVHTVTSKPKKKQRQNENEIFAA